MSASALVGRERELALLIEDVRDPPVVVGVEGEAGVGKTRLVSEAFSDPVLSGRRILVGHCHRLREPFPLGPVLEALRDAGMPPHGALSPVVGALRPLLPEFRDQMPPRPELLGDSRGERHRVFRAIRELLAAFGPAVCVLEDVHWADEGTLEFLTFLCARPPAELAVVLTYRGEDLDGSSPVVEIASRPSEATRKTRIGLCPFSVEEVRVLACAILGADRVSAKLASELHSRTEGIPLAVLEVVGMLRDRGDLPVLEGGRETQTLDQLSVPRVIRQSILERMRVLSADALTLVRAAAVLGYPCQEDLMAKVAGLSSAHGAAALTQALSSTLIHDLGTGLYEFRHVLAAQAVYEDIPRPQRRRMHLVAAQVLESSPGPPPLAQIGHHYKHAERPSRSARYLEAAAEAASSFGDHPTATRLLEESLSTAGLSRAARVRMAIRLGDAALYSPAPHAAMNLLRATLEDPKLPAGVRGELRFSLSRLLCHVGGDDSWRSEMATAVQELNRRPGLAARAMVNLALPGLWEGSVSCQLAWLDRAVNAAERDHDPVVRIAVSAHRASMLLQLGDPAGWRAVEAMPTEVHTVEQQLQLVRGYSSVSMAALGIGHYGPAESFLIRADQIRDQLGHEWLGLWLKTARGHLDWAVGCWEGLEARTQELIESTTGAPFLLVDNQILFASLLLCHGDVREAERTLTSALRVAIDARWSASVIAILGRLARTHLAQGKFVAANEEAARGLELVERKRIWPWGIELVQEAVQALLACGDREAASTLVDEFAARLRGLDAPAAGAGIASCRASVAEADGDLAAAIRGFAEAEGIWRAMPDPYRAAQALERQARCLLTNHDQRGGDLLLSALLTFEELGASRDAARVRAEFRARRLALPQPRRGGRRSYGEQLSPREAEVALLAASGHSNAEIAEMLFISQHTVANHVASALRKQRVASRRELAPAVNPAHEVARA